MALMLLFLFMPSASRSQPRGVVEGRLINRTDPSIIPRATEIDVIELGEGMSIIQTAKSDSAGRFRIEGVDANRRLMIRASYQSANYHSIVSFDAQGKAYVQIEVFESTNSMKNILVENVRMAFQMDGDQLKSLETISFNNKTHPPRTFTNPEGTFRFSKPPGILEIPLIRVTAPGSSMPLVQAALESPDGKSYYTLYPLKPGITTFEIQQRLPYRERRYAYVKNFYHDIGWFDIGVSPQDMLLSGPGLSLVRNDAQNNISIYVCSPIKAGSELTWNFSGGTPVAEPEDSNRSALSEIKAMPGSVGRNAFVIGPLVLMVLVIILWYGFNRAEAASPWLVRARGRQLAELQDHLLNQVAELDHKLETRAIRPEEYFRKREECKRRLQRVFLLLNKS